VRYRWEDDGSLTIRCRLPAVEGKAVLEAMEAAVDALREATAGTGKTIAPGRRDGCGGSSAEEWAGTVAVGCGASEPAVPPPLVAGAPDPAGSCGFRGLDDDAAVEEKPAGESSAEEWRRAEADACVPEWMGERPDYGWITDALPMVTSSSTTRLAGVDLILSRGNADRMDRWV